MLRPARQEGRGPNGKKTAQQSNSESVSLHTVPGDFEASPHGSATASAAATASANAAAEPSKSPGGRRSTATGTTATRNGTTASKTTRERRGVRTGWEFRRACHKPFRRRRRGWRPLTFQQWYPRLVKWAFDAQFVLVSQLQRRFPQHLRSERSAQRHAAKLVELGYLATVPVRAAGPNDPDVLYTTKKGRRLLIESFPGDRRLAEVASEEVRASGRALASMLHAVPLSEFQLAVHKTIEGRGDIRLLEDERRYGRSAVAMKYIDDGDEKRWQPDYGFLPAIVGSRGERRIFPQHFVEYENGTHSTKAIGKKLHAFGQWLKKEAIEYLGDVHNRHGEQKTNLPRLLVIVSDKYGRAGDTRVLLDWLVQGQRIGKRAGDCIWLTTADQLEGHQHDNRPLDAALWYRLKDVRRFAGEVDAWHEATDVQRRKTIAAMLPHLRQHTLFPHTR